jgi:dTDP-glucose 4,6-dehydratase
MGHEVFGIGRSKPKDEPFTLGLDWEYHQHHITYEIEPIVHLLRQKKPDFIVNFAAQGESAASFTEDSWRYYETNCVGLSRLVHRIDSVFIQIGSSEVYGPTVNPALESQAITPTSPYSISKGAFDQHLQSVQARIVPFSIIRPSNGYCPGQQLHRIIPKALLLGIRGEKLQLQGGGRAKKSYLYAEDISRAILAVCLKGQRGEIYNVGPNDPTSIREVVEICATLSGRYFNEFIEDAPARFGEDKQYWINSDKIKALGWKPETSLKAGIGRVWEWVKQYKDQLKPAEFQLRP